MRPVSDSALIKEFTIDLTAAHAEHDIATVTGTILIFDYALYVSTAVVVGGGGFTEVNIHTDDTTQYEFLTAVEGATANLLEGAQLTAAGRGELVRLSNGKKIQYHNDGACTAGALKFVLWYKPVSGGSYLS